MCCKRADGKGPCLLELTLHPAGDIRALGHHCHGAYTLAVQAHVLCVALHATNRISPLL